MPEPSLRPAVTAALARGVVRLMGDHGFPAILEVGLPNGRRADVMGLGPRGEVWIVETKSCLEDFAVDTKWPDYLAYCDRFHFAVAVDFPLDALPADIGVIVADGFGGEIVRESALGELNPARRRSLVLTFARLAALRLTTARENQSG